MQKGQPTASAPAPAALVSADWFLAKVVEVLQNWA